MYGGIKSGRRGHNVNKSTFTLSLEAFDNAPKCVWMKHHRSQTMEARTSAYEWGTKTHTYFCNGYNMIVFPCWTSRFGVLLLMLLFKSSQRDNLDDPWISVLRHMHHLKVKCTTTTYSNVSAIFKYSYNVMKYKWRHNKNTYFLTYFREILDNTEFWYISRSRLTYLLGTTKYIRITILIHFLMNPTLFLLFIEVRFGDIR